ncbi:MAG: signal peptidase I [Gammaproteobacteria bacterium]|nr:signal peptidase I [Gammaproteobacteria bacterium]
MIIDFAFVLVALLFVSGAILLADRLWLRTRRPPGAREPVPVDYARSFFPVILLVLVLRSFLFEPFRIPSDSMMPTLVQGDFIFVNKWRYGLRLPVLNTRIVAIGSPQRGDVIVFRKPTEPSVTFIKRLVGLPGDVIRVTERGVFVNDVVQPLRLDGLYEGPKESLYPFTVVAEEQLGTARHRIMLDPARPAVLGEWRVPEGHFFFMGDNRNNSRDSRFPEVGFVPEGNIVGKAVVIWLSFSPDKGRLLLWERMGSGID